MDSILIIGIIIFTGFAAGELCTRIGLPKVTGYILAGLLLNPGLTHFIPKTFVEHTEMVTGMALAFITFSVGGTLFFPKIRALGKSIMLITLFEAQFAFLLVAVVFAVFGRFFVSVPNATMTAFFLPLALLMASLASPTDPSATLAVEHEYHARGKVTDTIMGVAAFDDIFGIINYSLAVSVAGICVLQQPFGVNSLLKPLAQILGSIVLGGMFGWVLNLVSALIRKESEGVLITFIFSLLALGYGITERVGGDALLATMTMGVIVVNFNIKQDRIFRILERYTEELIFVLFFTISAMHLNISVLAANYLLIVIFVLIRALGKYAGTQTGARLSKSTVKVRKFTTGGLIPQGGIVIGLALVIRQNPAFNALSDIVLNVIIGATIVHEIIGPVIAKYALTRAGEISKSDKK